MSDQCIVFSAISVVSGQITATDVMAVTSSCREEVYDSIDASLDRLNAVL
jgi:hypothetical protein